MRGGAVRRRFARGAGVERQHVHRPALRVCPGHVHRVGRSHARVAAPAHAAHVSHQCHLGDRHRRLAGHRRPGAPDAHQHPRGGGHLRLDDEHRERLPDHRPHAQDVQGAEGARPEMRFQLIQAAYLASSVLFIFSLYWMNHPRTARRGVFAGVAGMTLAILGTLLQPGISNWGLVGGAVALGFLVGIPLSWVPLTAVPQRTALSHAFGGLAAGLVGTAKYIIWLEHGQLTTFRMSAIALEVILGFLTFTGSLMAAGKLMEIVPTRPITYRNQNLVNLLLLAVAIAA